MSRTPSTSTGTEQREALIARRGLDLGAQRVPERRQDHRVLRERRRAAPARRRASSSVRRHEPDEVLVEEVLDDEARVDHRLGDDGLRQLPARDLGREPLRRALGDAQRRAPGACRRRSATTAGTSHRLIVPTTPRVAWPVWRPWSIERSARRASSSRRTWRARSSTSVAELGRHRTPAAPGEEVDAELVLELADLVGDVRLHRVQAVGGAGERARVLRSRAGSRDGEAPWRSCSSLVAGSTGPWHVKIATSDV